MAGFENDVVVGKNLNFDQAAAKPHLGIINAAGKFPIGTGNTAPTAEILAGKIVSPLGTLSIGYSSPNITMDLTGGGMAVEHLTGDSGGQLNPDASNNFTLSGQAAGSTTVFDTIGSGSTIKFEDRSWLTPFVVDPSSTVGLRGTFSTIQAAINAASSGQTIFIRPGTYAENLTLKAGVNLSAFASDSSLNGTGDVIINGTCTLTTAGSVTISGIQLQTNSAALLAVTGNAASVVNLVHCYLNISNNTGITYSSSSASSAINLMDCSGNIGTTGIGIYTHTGAGAIFFNNSIIKNSGNSTTASSCASGSVQMFYSSIFSPLSTSSTGAYSITNSVVDGSAANGTALTTAGTGTSSVTNSYMAAGTSSVVSAGAGTTVNLINSVLNSSNTNVLTGAGTITVVGVQLNGSSRGSNATTQTGGVATGLTQGTAPSAGYIGERMVQTGTGNLANNTPTSLNTGLALTAGIWDITGMAAFQETGASTYHQVGISTTTNTFAGNEGDQNAQFSQTSAGAISITLCVPAFRVTISSSTTYYLVGQANFSAGANSTPYRISAVRVG